MFYQFSVTPESRNYLKFLWWKDGDLEKEPQEYRMAVHLFGASSSPGCANFGLKHLAREHKANYPLASTFVEKNFYVDDGLVSVSSVEEAKKLITESQELCKKGGLRLHKFNSNEEAALSCLDLSERATTIETPGFDLTCSRHSMVDKRRHFQLQHQLEGSIFNPSWLFVCHRLSLRSTWIHCSIQLKWKTYPSRALSQRHRMG